MALDNRALNANNHEST